MTRVGSVVESLDYKKKVFELLLASALLVAPGNCSERARVILLEHSVDIHEASRNFNISSRLLASIVYAEHSLNVRPGEEILENVLAASGHNVSIGVAQVKIETALWIVHKLGNPVDSLYDERLAVNLNGCLRKDFVSAVSEPRTNLMFAAAYIWIIVKLWNSMLLDATCHRMATGIVATLYSIGIVRQNGTYREPHAGAAMNHFGEVAQSFFDSFELRDEFD